MEGIVFVYIFKAISFAGLLNEYSPFACLQLLIRCFLFANVNESLLTPVTTTTQPAPDRFLKLISYSCIKGCQSACSCRKAGCYFVSEMQLAIRIHK